MKKKVPASKFLILVTLLFMTITARAQTSYTWNGSASSDWATAANWTPSGVPGAPDNVTIVNGTNQPVYNGITGVTGFTITSGTLDLGGFTFNISGNTDCKGGTINNGTISSTGNNSSYNGTVFNGNVTAKSATLYLNTSTFNGTVNITKTGATNDYSGGNTFNGVTAMTNSGSGYTVFTSDIFNSDATFTMNGSYFMAIGYGSKGTKFNGNVIVNSTGASVSFGQQGGECILAAGKTISVGSTGFLGSLYLENFTQTGSTPQNLTLGGYITYGPNSHFGGSLTSTCNNVVTYTNSIFDGPTSSTSAGVEFHGSTFNSSLAAIKNGVANDYSGGNTFNGVTYPSIIPRPFS